MNEIEVKAKLNNKDNVLKRLENMGIEILDTKYQKDIAFWPNDRKTIEEGHIMGRNYLRIRIQEKQDMRKIIFTLKQDVTSQFDCKEYEIEIQEKDINSLTKMILEMGYYEFITIEKNRTTAKIKDIEICLDDVKDLGSFIELEKFGESEKANEIQRELYGLMNELGIESNDYVNDGYDILLYRKYNNL